MMPSLIAPVKAGLLASRWYTRRLAHDTFPGVVVLCYHGVRSRAWRADESAFPNLHVGEATFDGHCRVIAQTCQPIGLDDWRTALSGGRPLPPRPVLGRRSTMATAACSRWRVRSCSGIRFRR